MFCDFWSLCGSCSSLGTCFLGFLKIFLIVDWRSIAFPTLTLLGDLHLAAFHFEHSPLRFRLGFVALPIVCAAYWIDIHLPLDLHAALARDSLSLFAQSSGPGCTKQFSFGGMWISFLSLVAVLQFVWHCERLASDFCLIGALADFDLRALVLFISNFIHGLRPFSVQVHYKMRFFLFFFFVFPSFRLWHANGTRSCCCFASEAHPICARLWISASLRVWDTMFSFFLLPARFLILFPCLLGCHMWHGLSHSLTVCSRLQ